MVMAEPTDGETVSTTIHRWKNAAGRISATGALIGPESQRPAAQAAASPQKSQ